MGVIFALIFLRVVAFQSELCRLIFQATFLRVSSYASALLMDWENTFSVWCNNLYLCMDHLTLFTFAPQVCAKSCKRSIFPLKVHQECWIELVALILNECLKKAQWAKDNITAFAEVLNCPHVVCVQNTILFVCDPKVQLLKLFWLSCGMSWRNENYIYAPSPQTLTDSYKPWTVFSMQFHIRKV